LQGKTRLMKKKGKRGKIKAHRLKRTSAKGRERCKSSGPKKSKRGGGNQTVKRRGETQKSAIAWGEDGRGVIVEEEGNILGHRREETRVSRKEAQATI